MHDFALRVNTEKKTSLFFTGQAGFILKSRSGQLLGVDLYLSHCVEREEGHMGFKRLLPRILEPSELEFDVLIATHSHFDHFDMDSLPIMMTGSMTKLYASLRCKEEVHRLKMESKDCIWVCPFEEYRCGDFYMIFTECDHGDGAPDAVGVIIEVDGYRVYFAGDTCFRPDRTEKLLKHGTMDAVCGPINGAYGNMNEEEFAQFVHALGARVAIPCHYGMFAAHGGNPGKFYEIMRKSYPDDPILLMCQGERYVLE